MRRAISVIMLFSSIALFGGCSGLPNAGSASVGGTASSVTLTPGIMALTLGATQQFTANVAGATDQTVEWEVNGVPGGNAASGLISEGGVYLAPYDVTCSSDGDGHRGVVCGPQQDRRCHGDVEPKNRSERGD